MILYDYFRSSAAYRVRIVLNLKSLKYEQHKINLVEGEQSGPEYLKCNPQGLVPALALDDGTILNQSIAIIEYLDEVHPQPALLPADTLAKARVRALVQAIASDMHPVNNLRVLKYLVAKLGADESAKMQWYQHWIAEGFKGIEAMLSKTSTAGFCHGDSPTLADACLIPQVYNAQRFECDLSGYPLINTIAENCAGLEAFAAAHPDRYDT